MQASVSFLCNTLSKSRYFVFDQNGIPEEHAPHVASYSLLPIVSRGSDVSQGATLWLFDTPQAAIHLSYACAQGVRVVVCSQLQRPLIDALSPEQRAGLEVVEVEDSNDALLVAARAWRGQCMLPIVGVTGSVGKTTTKHMLGTIFAQDNLPIFISSGNQSTLEGLALNILHITDKHVAAVFEIGINERGEMEQLVDLLQPTMGAITSVSAAHLHGLGSVQEVALEKRKIFGSFSPSQIGIVCGDYPLLTGTAYQHPVVRFGLKYKNMVTAKKVEVFTQKDGSFATRCLLRVYDYEQEVVLPGHHVGIVYAALAASTIAYFLHTPFETIVAGIRSFVPLSNRFEMRSLRDGRGTVVNDACNANNPESMKAALHAMHTMHAPQKIAVLADMNDLGTKQYFWHRHVGRELIKTRSISQLVLVGQLARAIGPVAPATMDVSYVNNWEQAHDQLGDLLAPKDNLVLVKGSPDLGLNRLVEKLVS